MASNNLQIREEQPPDRPEPAQIARDRSLKQIKSKYKTRESSDGKKVLLHDRDNQFPGQHLSVIIGNTMFCTKKLFHQRHAFCHPSVTCHCVPEHIK